MARKRKAKTNRAAGSEEKKKENYECCGMGKHNKIISIGLLLIIMGFAVKVGWNIADLFLLLGAIFLVKGLLLSVFKR